MDQEHDGLKTAVTYLRIAHTSGGSDNAIVAQRRACEQIAARYNATILREYIDNGKPARLAQQTELQHLLADLEQLRDADYVVVWDYARLGRDLQSLDDVIRRIQNCGAEIATITGMEAAERFTRTWLLDQVAEWARRPPERGEPPANEPSQLTSSDDLTAAVRAIRSGRINANQCESLATLLNIAANADTLPTPVAAAVFNAIESCKRTAPVEEANNKNEGR